MIGVTSLADSGPGTLRAAVEAAGPRMIVFRVGGLIDRVKPLRITEPFITIAGQTAPGDGICLRGSELSIHTHDVVVRHLRSRPGDILGEAVDAVNIGGESHDVICGRGVISERDDPQHHCAMVPDWRVAAKERP